jgi:hypothetical protein
MSNRDQHLIDHLYNTVCLQKLRCDFFYNGTIQANSIWNKYTDEKKILDITVNNYKNFYKNKVEELKTKVSELKEQNINSYLTYDTEYYINQYNSLMEDINKYCNELEEKTVDDLQKVKLSYISKNIEELFPNFTVNPVLLN